MPTLVDIVPAPAPLADTVREGLAAVIDTIDAALASDRPEVARLIDHALRYRGKMFRPALTLVAAAAAEPDFDADHPRFPEVVNAAAVVEIIHLATLVHDDVLDHAESRRGQPSLNTLTTNETAVILGDYLFATSFHLCSQLPVRHPAGIHSATRVGEITARVCSGELDQLTNRHNPDLPADRYFRIIEDKTAALIAASAELGSRHAGADETSTAALSAFGLNAGVAFQIRDDLLDLTGDADTVGKPLGRDLELGKLTLPLIHHLAAANGEAEALRAALAARTPLDAPLNDPGLRRQLTEQLAATGSIQHATDAAHDRINAALAATDALPASAARDYLRELARTVLHRPA